MTSPTSRLAATLLLGARVAANRIGVRSASVIGGGAIIFCAIAAWAERYADSRTALNLALYGPTFGLAIPAASLVLVSVALSRSRLDYAVECISLLGANRRTAALGALLATSGIAALAGSLTAAVTVLVANARWDAASLHDAITCAWIGAMTAGVYVFFFGAASTVGKRGGGRILAFIADWLLGPMVGAGALVFPRSHALNLLGADPVLDLPQTSSYAILLALVLVYAAAAALRTGR